jgi:DNA-binding response OmpR family regulator
MSSATGALPLAGLTLLVVEDEFLVAAMLADALEDAGARVIGPAGSLGEGLALAEGGGFDGAVLDWNLAGASSEPIARVVVARGAGLVIATGYHKVPEEFAAVPLIGKPFDLARLIAILAELLSRPA